MKLAQHGSWRRALIVIGTAALILRVVLILTTPHFALIYDSKDYEAHGAAISLGFGYPRTQVATLGTPSAFRPPADPYLLGGLYAVFGIHPDLGRLLGALLGTVTVVLTACLGAALWDRRVGLWAGGVAAVCPVLIDLNGSILSESLFLPVELGLALVLLRIRRSGPDARLACLAGVLCGLAALTRTNGIVFAAPALWAILAGPADWRRRATGAFAALIAVVLVLTPWTVRNEHALHAFVPLNTQTGITLAGVYNPAARHGAEEGIWRAFPSQTPALGRELATLYTRPGGVNEAQLDDKLTGKATAYITRHPGYFALVNVLDGLRMFDLGKGHTFTTDRSFAEMNVPASLRRLTTVTLELLALVALAGLAARLARRGSQRPLGPGVVWAIPVLGFLTTIPVEGSLRYGEIIDPFIILLACLAAAQWPAGVRAVRGAWSAAHASA